MRYELWTVHSNSGRPDRLVGAFETEDDAWDGAVRRFGANLDNVRVVSEEDSRYQWRDSEGFLHW